MKIVGTSGVPPGLVGLKSRNLPMLKEYTNWSGVGYKVSHGPFTGILPKIWYWDQQIRINLK